MDIFQNDLPRDCEVPHSPSIPYLGSLEFDGGAFEDYPTRIGFAMSSPSELEMETGDHYAEHTALLQTWLYFGLIAALSKDIALEIDLPNPIQKQWPGSMVVNCVAVGAFLRQWRSYLDAVLRRESWKAHVVAFSQVLSVSFRNARLHAFDVSNDGEHPDSKPRAGIVLGIKALLRAFHRILLHPRSFHRKEGVYRHHLTKNDYLSMLVERMQLLYDGSPEHTPPSAFVAREFLDGGADSSSHETAFISATISGTKGLP